MQLSKSTECISSPQNAHPRKIKLPAKVHADDSPPVSDEEEEDMNSPSRGDSDEQDLFQVNVKIKVKKPSSFKYWRL